MKTTFWTLVSLVCVACPRSPTAGALDAGRRAPESESRGVTSSPGAGSFLAPSTSSQGSLDAAWGDANHGDWDAGPRDASQSLVLDSGAGDARAVDAAPGDVRVVDAASSAGGDAAHGMDASPAEGGMVKAFPTAQGFGASTRGAYGKPGVTPTVYTVTNLNDPLTRTSTFDGSLRWALEAPEPRVVVFAVAGYIEVKRLMEVLNPYLDLEAQTAPGDGVALRADPTNGRTLLRIITHDVIVRHLRVRPGRANSGVAVDGQQAIQVGGTGTVPAYNVVVDHCSATWGIDGQLQTANETHDVTFQWCVISEGLNNAGHTKGNHSRAVELYVGDRTSNVDVNGRITLHHNLMSHVEYRVPQISLKNGLTEVINNVIYHTTQMGISVNGNAHTVLGDSKTRIVNNYLLRVAQAHQDVWLTSGDVASGGGHQASVRVHVHGNLGPSRLQSTLADNLSMSTETTPGCATCYATTPATARNHWTSDPLCTSDTGTFPYPQVPVAEDPAQVALEKVSGTGAFNGQSLVGATKPRRDAVDARILLQLTAYMANANAARTVPVPGGPNGGLLDDPAQVGGYPPLLTGTAPLDSDHDGMPDAWEGAHGLNAANPQDAHLTATNEYSHLENYLNQLAGDDVP